MEIEIIKGYPAIYIPKLDLVTISDLQIGYESHLAEKGVFVPQKQTKEMIRNLKEISFLVNSKRLLINGDIKHEFSKPTSQEIREVKEFLTFAKQFFKEIIIVKGNHDNFILNILEEMDFPVYDPYYEEKGFCFLHGDKEVDLPECNYLIIGHEQPMILLKEGFDKIRVKALLIGKFENYNLVVLPAFSTIAAGSEVNVLSREELLSPILKKCNLDEFEVYAIEERFDTLYLGKLKNLKYE
ncbi:MAG: metallophosphoesterase [Candidatus Aenigmatarchaeota archaeon]